MSKFSKSSNRVKPEKPRQDFPLYPHASGKWAKVIRGKMYYFGSWDDPLGAEDAYLAVSEDLHAGREPRAKGTTGPTVREACNAFVKSKRIKLDAGNLNARTLIGYDAICKLLVAELGANRLIDDLRPADFEKLYATLGKKHGSTSIGGQITQVRSVFKYAYEADLIEKPVRFGPTFKAPTAAEVRKAKGKQKTANGNKTLTADEIKTLLTHASPIMKAMILLGINCGFGNTDCSDLPRSAVDLNKGWIDFPRPKTGADRRIPLWPETINAIRDALSIRKEPSEEADADLVFITKYRQRWVRYDLVEEKKFGKTNLKPRATDSIVFEMRKLRAATGLNRPGMSFYALRHTFETVAGGCRDQVAVDAIMGHIDPSMAANYRHGIEDERLQAVVDHAHRWLFGEQENADD